MNLQPSEQHRDMQVDLSLCVISEHYLESAELGQSRRSFERDYYLKLPKLLNAACFSSLAFDMKVVEQAGRDRSFLMPGYETPRVLRTVGGQAILRHSPAIASLYFHRDLVQVLEEVAGTRIFPCQHAEEFMVANFLTSAGSTHGWHLDDPPLALVLFFEAPDAGEKGGHLEYIPDWRQFCASISAHPELHVGPAVERARAADLVKCAAHQPGDAYLLRADRCLHRVTPLVSNDCRRVVLNMAYQIARHQDYGNTANLLYGASQ